MSKSRHIPEDFFDAEYLYAYAEDFLNTKIATQIRILREQRGLTQEELAQKIGTKQPGIARLENVNYSAWKVETLKKLARAFDVVFIGGFISLSTFLNEAEKFGRKALEQPSFKDEIIKQEKDLEEGAPTITDTDHNILAKWFQIQEQIDAQSLRQRRPSILIRIENGNDIIIDMPNNSILGEIDTDLDWNVKNPAMLQYVGFSLEEKCHGR